MARTLTPDRERSGIAVGAILLIVFAGGSVGQISAIALGGLAGMWLCRGAPAANTGHLTCPFPRWVAVAAISLFVVLLLLTPALAAATGWQALALFDAFYRAGALVFGGGHVVLPLLQAEVVAPGWISHDAILDLRD